MGQVVFEQTGGPFLSIYDSNCRNSCLFTVRGQKQDFILPCSILGESLYGGKTAVFP